MEHRNVNIVNNKVRVCFNNLRIALRDLINTNTVMNFRIIRTNILHRNSYPYDRLQLILLRLIRTPDKANRFRPYVGVCINDVLM